MMRRSRKAAERTSVAHRVTFIPGDGTGPEISEATQRGLEATGVDFEWDFQNAGADVYEEGGTPPPDRRPRAAAGRGHPAPRPRARVDQGARTRDKGPADHARRLRLPLDQRGAA